KRSYGKSAGTYGRILPPANKNNTRHTQHKTIEPPQKGRVVSIYPSWVGAKSRRQIDLAEVAPEPRVDVGNKITDARTIVHRPSPIGQRATDRHRQGQAQSG